MLGWKVYVKKEPDTLIASWYVGLGGLFWIDELVKEGLAQDLGGHGYPNTYSAKSQVILPKIYPKPPTSNNAKAVIGDNYILSNDNCWNVELVELEIQRCRTEETLIIEAWDMS